MKHGPFHCSSLGLLEHSVVKLHCIWTAIAGFWKGLIRRFSIHPMNFSDYFNKHLEQPSSYPCSMLCLYSFWYRTQIHPTPCIWIWDNFNHVEEIHLTFILGFLVIFFWSIAFAHPPTISTRTLPYLRMHLSREWLKRPKLPTSTLHLPPSPP